MAVQDKKSEASGAQGEPVQLAVFDFDGTCIAGNSPVLLVRHLVFKNMIGFGSVVKMMLWGAMYKLRLPQNEEWVRSHVFSAFDGMRKEKADEFLREFYDETIQARFRPQIDVIMRDHLEKGHDVIVASASFEPIILRAMECHPFTHQVSTRMRVDDAGCYTREVEGCAIEGVNKLEAVKAFADAVHGEGNWTIAYAYGDHHSDTPLLEAAQEAIAVAPDSALRKTAQKQGWLVLDWERRAFF